MGKGAFVHLSYFDMYKELPFFLVQILNSDTCVCISTLCLCDQYVLLNSSTSLGALISRDVSLPSDRLYS
jgi:hypothetical protein